MCGIAGLYLKSEELHPRLGELFAPMLVAMSSRGPDSAGFGIYGDAVEEGCVKLTLCQTRGDIDWEALADDLGRTFHCDTSVLVNATYAVIKIAGDEAAVRERLRRIYPLVRIMSAGRSIEILKEVGLSADIVDRFKVRGMKGSHVVGHTRMATESAVTTDGSHPFSTGLDLCLVHNGSLSNHNRWRDRLRRYGIPFRTDNDSEVAAGYMMWRLQQGATLRESLESALHDLDGFYTFAIGTADGFAVLRDPIACKPAVMAETDKYVAIGSEYRALAELPGVAEARLWEPEPGVVYTWGHN